MANTEVILAPEGLDLKRDETVYGVEERKHSKGRIDVNALSTEINGIGRRRYSPVITVDRSQELPAAGIPFADPFLEYSPSQS